ncbi:MAG: ImmA/IrrE family metallo-endopeptidase [Ruminococcus albus]|nr:ImmA/IrrE family metallo-endopeptidase [Ruminococcus albus]
MSRNHIYKKVMELIDKHGTRNPYELADALGIKIIETSIRPLQGAFYIIFDQPTIFIEETLREDQKLIVCGHENGHAVLHPELVRNGNLAEFEVFDMREPIEYEANIFAAHLLIDEDEMLHYLRMGYTVFQTAIMMKVNPNLVNIKLSEMNGWGYNFDTSWGNHDLFR